MKVHILRSPTRLVSIINVHVLYDFFFPSETTPFFVQMTIIKFGDEDATYSDSLKDRNSEDFKLYTNLLCSEVQLIVIVIIYIPGVKKKCTQAYWVAFKNSMT